MLLWILSLLCFTMLVLCILFESIDFLIIYILLRILIFVLEFEERNQKLTEEDISELYAEADKKTMKTTDNDK